MRMHFDKQSLKVVLIFSIVIAAINMSIWAGVICFVISLALMPLVACIMNGRMPVSFSRKRKTYSSSENRDARYRNIEI